MHFSQSSGPPQITRYVKYNIRAKEMAYNIARKKAASTRTENIS